ncbi:MAG: LysM peptidoglycan-binding domain-containing protein, partial [Sideroxydans sp.]|nr:LysM peptidoglycan-binding domain-containing protein [Sideroxydans sp.]
EAAEEFSPFNMHASATREMSGFSYSVRKGDTISTLARRFHTSKASLVAMNNGKHRLRVGQRFTILPGASSSRRVASKKVRAKQAAGKVSKKRTQIKRAASKRTPSLAAN